jgi:hypothetical protein
LQPKAQGMLLFGVVVEVKEWLSDVEKVVKR